MRLPGNLLDQIRVGVGVGAVMLGGCDLADRAREALSPADEAVASAEPEIAPEPEPAVQPEPAPARAEGIPGKVAQALDAAKSEAELEPEPFALPQATPAPSEPEDITAFVPFGGSKAPTRPKAAARGPRPTSKPLAIAEVDEPCGVISAPVASPTPRPSHRPCPACGRG